MQTRVTRWVVATLILVAALAAAPALAQRGGGGGGGGRGGGGGGLGGPGADFPQTGGRGNPTPGEGQRPSRPDETPTFRSSVTVVQIDAIVTDLDGKPVTGLTADDFEVFEAGRAAEITTFAAVDIPPPTPDPVVPGAPEPDMRSNLTPPGRTYLIALDEVAPDRALRARHILRRFINEYMGPNDVAAVALTGRGLANSGQDFTNNKRLVMNAIDKFSGGFETPDDPSRPVSSDGRQLASSLRRLTEFLATMPGRKVMIYVGEGLGGLDPYQATDYRGGALTPAGLDAHAAIAAATRGNITIYPIDPRGLSPDLTAAESFDTTNLDARADLAAIADVTGGFSLTNSNNVSGAFERLVRENSSYYTIGFGSERDRLDGRFVGVQVRVKKPGLQVRARNGYVAPLEREKERPVIDADARMESVATAISNAVAVNDVPMRVAATAYRGKGKNASVALVIEFDVSRLDLVDRNDALTGNVEVTYIATDDKGKVKPGLRRNATITLKKEAAAPTLRVGARAVSEIELPPGRYQLRVAVGSTFRAGSVIYDLEVPDFSDHDLMLSGIALTSGSAPAVLTLTLKDPLGAHLPGPPIAVREFARQDILGMYVEVYENGNATTPATITAELRSADGAVTRPLNPQKALAAMHAKGGRGVISTLALDALTPGAYVLRVEAHREGTVSVRREIPLRIF